MTKFSSCVLDQSSEQSEQIAATFINQTCCQELFLCLRLMMILFVWSIIFTSIYHQGTKTDEDVTKREAPKLRGE